MARVQIDSQPWGAVWDAFGNSLDGLAVDLKIAGTATDATHYSAETGGSATVGNLETNQGLIKATGSSAARWIETGPYDLTVDGVTRRVDAVSSLQVWGNSDVLLNSMNFPGLFSSPAGTAQAIEDAITAAIPATDPVTTTRQATRRLHFPPGTYERNDGEPVLSFRSVQGLNIRTGGPQATIFKQKANADSVVDLNGVGRAHFDGFSVQTDSTVTVDCGVQLYWDNAGTTPSGQAARSTLELHFDFIEISNFWGVTGVQFGYTGFSNQVDGISVGHISMTGGWQVLAVTGVAATDVFTSTAHGLTDGQTIVFTDKTAGAGITVGTTYYMRDVTTDSFKVATTLGGSAVDLTSDMTAGHIGRADLWQAGFKCGHGTTGNNFLHNVELLSITNYRKNLYMARSGLHVGLARFQTGEHDIYLDGPSNHGLTVEHGRSESSVRFIGSANNGTAVSQLHLKDYKWGPGINTAADREIVSYHFPGTAKFENVLITPAPPTSVCWANFGPTRPLSVFIEGWANEGVESSAFSFGANVDANVDGYRDLTSGAVDADPLVPVVASAATIALPWSADVISISGTANITSITATGHVGKRKTLVFTGTASGTGLTDGSNLKLGGNFVYTPDDAITLVCDGVNWYADAAGGVN